MNKYLDENFLFEHLQYTQKPIYIYGMGNGAEKLKTLMDKYNISLDGIFASDEYVRGHSFLGFVVKKYSEIPKNAIILLAFGAFTDELLERFNNMAKAHEFYAPDMPLFGNENFDPTKLLLFKDKIQNAYDFLSDDLSRKVFKNTILHKISGKINYLRTIESDRSEIFEKLIKLNNNESYLDLGAYDGDTIREFQNLVNGNFKEITAIEPDRKNFKKLISKTKNANCLNIGIYNYNGTLNFSTEGSRNSSFRQDGKSKIEVKTIDTICKGKDLTFIKMDVEGSEKEALEGGTITLQQQKPKMIVSAYHRTYDFFLLINQIKEINPDYKIYLRHQPYVPNWETNIIAI